MHDDTTAQSIRFASFTVLGIAILALLVGLIIPFNVEQPATVQIFTGEADLVLPDGSVSPLQPDTTITLEKDQSVRTQLDSEAFLTFEGTQGRAILGGDTVLTLVESQRRATSLGHTLNRNEQTHTITLKQARGRVTYIFANTTPHFSDLELVIQLPDRNYVPDEPCWTLTIDTSGHSTVEALTCPVS